MPGVAFPPLVPVVRHPEPYVVAAYADAADLDRDSLVDVLDMSSGRIVRHVAAGDASDVVVSVAASGDLVLVCVKTIDSGRFRLLDPVTGAVHHLSGELAREHAARGLSLRDYGEPVYMVGQVAGTGEHKVLRMLPCRQQRAGGGDDLFEVCTLSSSSARWRGTQGPPRYFVRNEWTRVVVGGVVYCLSVAAYFAVLNRRADEQGWIVRFDLEMEQWRPSIEGPSGGLVGGYDKKVTLANLNGSLVIVHGSQRIMDLWFLMDSEEGVWVKQYSVQIERSGDTFRRCSLCWCWRMGDGHGY